MGGEILDLIGIVQSCSGLYIVFLIVITELQNYWVSFK